MTNSLVHEECIAIRSYTVATPLGAMVIQTNDDHLVGLYFSDQSNCPDAVVADEDHDHVATKVRQWLAQYFDGGQQRQTVAVAFVKGTPLQIAVWNELLSIPYGQTKTYLQIAKAVGKPDAVRAVGNAIGKNPIGILVPCHRVIGSSGALTGYAGGLHRKAWLLELERTKLFA